MTPGDSTQPMAIEPSFATEAIRIDIAWFPDMRTTTPPPTFAGRTRSIWSVSYFPHLSAQELGRWAIMVSEHARRALSVPVD